MKWLWQTVVCKLIFRCKAQLQR